MDGEKGERAARRLCEATHTTHSSKTGLSGPPAEGIRPGVRIGFDDRNYDGTLSISIDKRRVRLGTPAAEKIWVVKS